MSHTSGADDGFGFPGYEPSAPRPSVVQILEGQAPSNVGRVTFARPPYAAYKYSGGGVTLMQLLLTDVTGEPFAAMMRSRVLDPLGMTSSTFEQPPPDAWTSRLAHAHNGQGAHGNVAVARLSRAGGGRAVDHAQRPRPLRHRGAAGRARADGEGAVTGVGPRDDLAGGLRAIRRRAQRWSSAARAGTSATAGPNWGFRCSLVAHVRKGYGVVVMTNGDAGGGVIAEIEARVAAAYGWDSLDKPLSASRPWGQAPMARNLRSSCQRGQAPLNCEHAHRRDLHAAGHADADRSLQPHRQGRTVDHHRRHRRLRSGHRRSWSARRRDADDADPRDVPRDARRTSAPTSPTSCTSTCSSRTWPTSRR